MAVYVKGSRKTIVFCSNCGAQLIRRSGFSAYYCGIPCKSEWQRKQKPVNKEWLHQKYVVEGMDCTQIAKLVDRNPKSVWFWLKDFGIPTRSRGTNSLSQESRDKISASNTGKKRTEETRAKLRECRKESPNLPHLIGGVHHLKGKRGAETPNWKGGVTPERQKFYDSYEWKEAVKQVWRRDNAICQRCGLDCRSLPVKERRRSFVIHHVISFAYRPLRAEPSNLVLLCRPCHLWVHSRKNVNKEFIEELQKGTLPLWLKTSSNKQKDSIGNFLTGTQLKFLEEFQITL